VMGCAKGRQKCGPPTTVPPGSVVLLSNANFRHQGD
jgi:hypothetical protein